jgi:predicted RNA-binding protein with RPS1 domain
VHLTGIVDGHREFGVFVKLNDKQTGLLHISETRLPRGGNPVSKLENAFPADSEIEVVVKSLDGDRVSLTLPEMWKEQQAEAETDVQSYIDRGRKTRGLGSLGDALEGLDLPGT